MDYTVNGSCGVIVVLLILLLAIGFWFILQGILGLIFEALTGSEKAGKVIATVILVAVIIIYGAVNS